MKGWEGALQGTWKGLHDVADGLDRIPFHLLLVGHCLYVANLMRNACQGKWLANYWLAFFAGFGGGTASAILLFDPELVKIALFADDAIAIVWSLCWYVSSYSPGKLVHRTCDFRVVGAVLQACSDVLKVQTICARVDYAVVKYAGVHAAPVLLGTLGGCGGKLFCDFIQKIDPGSRASTPPTEFSVQTYSGRSSFLSALLYYVTVYLYPTGYRREVQTAIILLFLAKGVAGNLTGGSIGDPTNVPAKLFHWITQIPEGKGKATSGKETKNRTKKVKKKKHE